MRFYLDSTSSAERPSAHQIRDHISSTLPNAGGHISPSASPKVLLFRPFSQLVPLQPSAERLRDDPGHRDGAPRSISGHSCGGRPPGRRPGHLTTHRNFPEAPILNSLDPPPLPPPPPRAPGLAPLSRSAASLSLPQGPPCVLRGGKTPPGASRPRGLQLDLRSRRDPLRPTASAARPSRTLTSPSRSGHLCAHPQTPAPRFGRGSGGGGGGGPVERIRQW